MTDYINEQVVTMAHPNTTIQQVNESVNTPVFPKFTQPDSFVPGESNCVTFLKKYERCAHSNHWSEANKIAHFGNFLEGVAHTWYTDFISNADNANKTWNDISQSFQKYFGGITSSLEAKKKLRSKKQGLNELVLKYYYDVLELASQINPSIPMAEISTYFIEGLQPGLRSEFIIICPPTDEVNADSFRSAVFKLAQLQESRIQDVVQQQTTSIYGIATRAVNTSSTTTTTVPRPSPQYNRPAYEQFNRTNGENRQWNYNRAIRGRPSTLTRTRDARPICFSCNRPGHLAATCNSRPRNGEQQRRTVTFSNTKGADKTIMIPKQ
ncbi:hypothetical protein PPYR_01553 [Photinus pyralis]|uniref:CCHC-type domain-containing protein n=1 Tax=Photinus pyralis TaxID=7054 RepID=A0A5N4B4V8_PHOPY|nr:hypothetical protein PPYR_01553 [Photinus pyralis]